MNDSIDASAKLPAPHPISIEFFSKKANKTTQLVDSDGEYSLEGAHRWYDYEFLEPVYISNLRIDCSGYSSWNKFEVEVIHVDQTIYRDQIAVDGDSVSLELGKLAAGFRFRPETKWATRTDILNVTVSGYSLEEFHEFEWAIKDIREREAAISKKESQVAELESSIREKSENSKQLSASVGKLTAEQDQLDKKVLQLSEQIIDREAQQKDVQKEIGDLQEERREIRSQISADEAQLNNLTSKLRLFPSEIAGFVQEGGRSTKNYLLLSLPFIGILGIVLWSLFSNSIDLTQLWKLDDDVNVWTIFLTRLPFVLVAIALIETCGFIVGRLIYEIVRINRQRLEFSKLSIVAKDVVTAVSASTDMTEAEKFNEETKLKMALLQEHMKSHSEEEFRYSGSPISSAIIGVANRLIGNKPTE